MWSGILREEPTANRPPPKTERQVLAACLRVLRGRGIRHRRLTTGSAFFPDKSGKLVRRMLGRKGDLDLVAALPDGRYCEIEVKRPGKKPTREQYESLRAVNQAGGVGIWVDSAVDLRLLLGFLAADAAIRITAKGLVNVYFPRHARMNKPADLKTLMDLASELRQAQKESVKDKSRTIEWTALARSLIAKVERLVEEPFEASDDDVKRFAGSLRILVRSERAREKRNDAFQNRSTDETRKNFDRVLAAYKAGAKRQAAGRDMLPIGDSAN